MSWSDDSLKGELGTETTQPDRAAYSDASTAVLDRFQKTGRVAGTVPAVNLGRPRLAMNPGWPHSSALSDLHPERRLFFNPHDIFSEWVRDRKIDYRPGLKVVALVPPSAPATQTTVVSESVTDKTTPTFASDRIYLAAGTVGSFRIICKSLALSNLRRPLLDNPGLVMPFFYFGALGRNRATDLPRIPTFQLTALYSRAGFNGRIIANFLDMSQLSISELIRHVPLPVSMHFHIHKVLRDRFLISYNFFPCEPANCGSVRMDDTSIRVEPSAVVLHASAASALTSAARKWHLLPLYFAAKKMPFGASIHYAGTFAYQPVRKYRRDEFATDSQGRLSHLPHVHLVDGSTFPRLPAKNLSMTLAANAYRIARSTQYREAL